MLYAANFAAGLAGWTASSDWKTIGGMLVSDGGKDKGVDNDGVTLFAPYDPGDRVDYAVEAQMEFVRTATDDPNGLADYSFGVGGRATQSAGYRGGIGAGPGWSMSDLLRNPHAEIVPGGKSGITGGLVNQPYTVAPGFHDYRLELKGNTLRLLIDGTVVLTTADNTWLSPGQAGLWSNDAQLEVRSFKIIAL